MAKKIVAAALLLFFLYLWWMKKKESEDEAKERYGYGQRVETPARQITVTGGGCC